MKINPLNYLRQASAKILFGVPYFERKFPEYAKRVKGILSEAARSKKFVLPNGGRIFDTGLRAMPDVIRLPFPTIVIEYEAGDAIGVSEQVFGKENTTAAPKRIAYAQENDDGWIDVVVIAGTRDGNWALLPYFASVHSYEEGMMCSIDQEIASKTNAKAVNGLVTVMHKIGEVANQVDQWELRARVDTLDEVNSVLSLIEALSCINVSSDPIPIRKSNKSSAKRGAIPFDEYHTLTIKPSSGIKYDTAGSSGRTPREHLRRGHIRRISGGRRIWVNSCVVGAGSIGKITSDYEISKPSQVEIAA